MSLNGLDDVKIKEARDAAIAELGGWFLLKYVSRDEVALFERGNGGILDIRNAIAQYQEESPLFGFLRYRRRNVLIKYMPEGCSRLVQARVTVHFNAITEKFSPYDTLFPITSSKELKDSTLSAACSLHTASGSTSSSTSSLRRRRLMEIAEDENEDKRHSVVFEERSISAKADSVAASQQHTGTGDFALYPPEPKASENSLPVIPDSSTLSPPTALGSRPRSPTKSLDGRRKSSQSTRPDVYSYNSFSSNGKPKVKLGPRPSLDSSGRPQTSSSFGTYRPVSTLPPGIKLLSKKPKAAKEMSKMPPHNPPPIMTLSPPATSSDISSIHTTTLVRPHTSGGRPSTSSGGSIKAPLSPITTTSKPPAMTPEKLRLMKALQLRKRQMSAAAPAEPEPLTYGESPETSTVPEIRLSDDTTVQVEDALATSNNMLRADSGIAIEATSIEEVAPSDTTTMSSTPNSPIAPSEAAESTQASSVSDSTDETIQESFDSRRSKIADDSNPEPDESSSVQAVREDHTEKAVRDAVQSSSAENTTKHILVVASRDVKVKEGEYISTPPVFKSEPRVEMPSQQTGPDYVAKPKTDGREDNVAANNDTSHLDNTGSLSESEPDSEMTPTMEAHNSIQFKDIADVPATPIRTRKEVSPYQIVHQSIEVPQIANRTRELKIPRSKFSTEALAPRTPFNAAYGPTVPNVLESLSATAPKSPVTSKFSHDNMHSLAEDGQVGILAEQTKKKRRGLVDPIRTDLDRSDRNSEAEFLSDDDLMDELQSATVEEAKPIQVSKSPVSAGMTAKFSKTEGEGNRFSRAFSNPFQRDITKAKLLSPDDAQTDSPRSVSASAAFLNRANQQQALPVVKKVNLGSGISQRIKALEKLSSSTANPSPPLGTAAPSQGTSATFFSVPKPNSRAGSKSPSIVQRGETLTRNGSSPTMSRESSPEALKIRERSGSIQSRREAFASQIAAQPQRSRPESVSVTARIIRDPSQQFPQKPEIGKDPSDFSPLHLQQSPLVIDHQKAFVAPPSPKKDSKHERRLSSSSKEARKERRSSISLVKDLIKERRSSFAERRKSMTIEPPTPSSIRSSSRPPSTHNNSSHIGRPVSVSSRRSSSSRDVSTSGFQQSSSTPTSPADESDKKSNRTSRMLRKMSASLSASRKSLAHVISPTVREEFEPPSTFHQSVSSPGLSVLAAVTADIGDVNVQFPDTLLWKRRSMSLDSHGYLILTQAQGSKGTEKSNVVKKYHLSEFRTPFAPEMEAQELPNSVVLDFIEGGGLQVACEDRGGQLRVLQVLLRAHRSYGAFGQ